MGFSGGGLPVLVPFAAVVSMDRRFSARSTRKLPLFVLLGATSVSTFGNVITFVAVPWYVLQTTGSAAKTGIAGGTIALGAVLAGILGGPLVDRFGFKASSVAADVASGITVALIPLLHLTIGLAFWQLLVLVFLGSLLDAPGVTARESLIPNLAEKAGIPLERTNSAYQAIKQASMMLGPPVAGVLIFTLGASNVLWVDAATFAVSAFAIATFIPRLDRSADTEVEEFKLSYFALLAEGLGFIVRDRLVFSVVAVAVTANFLIDPLSSVVLPVFSEVVYGSAVNLGIILAGFGGGALTGAVLYGVVGPRLPRRWAFVATFAVAGVPLWVLTSLPNLAAATGTLFFMGLAFGPINPLLYTMLQERVPEEMLARVLGAFTALAMAAIPVGAVLAGFLIEAAGVRYAIAVIAATYSVVAFIVIFNPALEKMDEEGRTETEKTNAKGAGVRT